MTEQIFILDENHDLRALQEQRYNAEDDLQELLARHPELLGGEQMTPPDPRRWLLVGREVGIPDHEDGSNRWAIDHIFIDQDATPTFVETKQSTNPEIRRAIVGQMLEYATHARYWPVDMLRTSFEDSAKNQGEDPAVAIQRLLGTDAEADIDAFWQRVATNLDARRIRLLFVADEVPDPLKRVVEFLNEEMPNIEAFVVEIKQFLEPPRNGETPGLQTLVPRVFGRASQVASRGGARSTLRESEFFERFRTEAGREAARSLLDTARRAGASLEWGSSGVSVRGRSSLWAQPLTVAWLYPDDDVPHWGRTRGFSFGWGVSGYSALPEPLRLALDEHVARFDGDPFSHDASSQGVAARYVRADDAAANINVLCDRLNRVLDDLASARNA